MGHDMRQIISTASKDEIDTFTQGECHILAVALHRRFGWPIYLALDASEPYWTDPEDDYNTILTVCHAYAISPDGLAWDVFGARPLEAVPAEATSFYDIKEYDSDLVYSEDELRLYVGCWSDEGGDEIDRPLFEYTQKDVDYATRVLDSIFTSEQLLASDRPARRACTPQAAAGG